jgi:hypothetical protein
MRARESDEGVELVLDFLESGKGTPNDQPSHRVPNHRYFVVVVAVFCQLRLNLTCKSDTHPLYVSLSTRLIGTRHVNPYLLLVVSFQLSPYLFHVKPAGAKTMHQKHQHVVILGL